MKKFDFLRFFAVIVLTVGFIPACLNCNCKGVDKYFDIEGLEVENTNKSSLYVFPANSTVLFSDYSLYLRYLVSYHANACEGNHGGGYWFINSALACDCVPGDLGSNTEKIEDITVITLNDFDAEHPANDTITSLLTVKDRESAQIYEIDEFISTDGGAILRPDVLLFLKKAPETNPEFRAKVIFKLSTGEEYVAESEAVIIN